MCLSLSIVIFLIGPKLITLVFGTAFASAGPVVRVVLPGMIAYSMMPFLATFFVQQVGKPGFSTTIGALSIAVCAAVTLVTIHTLGIVAGALGTSLSYSAAFFVSAYLFSRQTNIPISKLFLLDAEDRRKYQDLYSALKGWAFNR
jgi:O-antigen/teichoic acid export membrane protein